MMKTRTAFKLVAYAEALTCVALFLIAMPMKYIQGVSEATRMPGMIHGIVFMLYMVAAKTLGDEEQWSRKIRTWSYLAGVIPFATVFFERKLKKDSKI